MLREEELAEEIMPTNAKETKGVRKAVMNTVGFVSFLFGSLLLLAIVFGMIGSIFMSTKRLFQLKRVKGEKEEFLEMGRAVDREMKREKNGLS